jgi:hypothetical protein
LPNAVLMGGILDEEVMDGTDAKRAQDFVESGGKEANVRGGMVAGVLPKGKEANLRGGMGAGALPNVVLMGGIDEGVTDGMDVERAQDFVESGGKEANVRGGTVAERNVVLIGGIDEGVTDGMDAKRAQDFVMGTADKQLGEKEYTGPMDVPNLKNDNSCKLWRELSCKDNAKVRRLLGLAEGDDTRFEFEEQLRRPRMKIEYGGKPYNCTKCSNLRNTTTICKINKNYKCPMVRGRGANAEWILDQEKRGTRVKKAEKEEDKNGLKSSTRKREVENEDLLKCAGTLRVIFWNNGQHTSSIINGHTCMMDGEWSDGKEKDERLPMTVVAPSIHWNFTEQHLLKMKSGLVSLTDARWSNLQGCRLEQQYLPELSTGTTKQMTDLRKKVEELINPFVKKSS